MSEMIERVAQALWDLDQSKEVARPVLFANMNATLYGAEWAGKPVPWDHVTGPGVVPSVAEEWRRAARAAIEAMREPTTEMGGAGYDNGYGVIVRLEPEAARSLWARAITAALGEPS